MFSSLTAGHDESQSTPMHRRAHRYDVYSLDTGDVSSPTSTSSEVRSPTSTSTDANTRGNFTATVTGGAGAGATTVSIYATPLPANRMNDTGGNVQNALAAARRLGALKAAGKLTQADIDAAMPILNKKSSLGDFVKSAGSTLGSVAKVAGSVVSYVPGVGTAVGAGLKVAGAGLSGENMAKAAVNAVKTAVPYVNIAANAVTAAKDIASGKNVFGAIKQGASNAALDAIPGGDYGKQLAKSVVAIGSAGVKGQNVLKAGAQEVVASAIAMAPAVSRETLNAAINAAAKGQNPLTGAAGGAVRTALAQIPDSAARKTAEQALSGVSAAKVLAQAPKQLLAKAAAAAPNGGAAAAFKTLTGTTPEQLAKGTTTMNNVRPTLTSVTSSRPFFFDRPSVTGRPSMTGVRHIPMSGAAKAFVRTRAGMLARDASGLRSDGKWLVTKGDTGESIAFALTGVKGRWTELKAANPTLMKARAAAAKQYGFPIYVNDVINLPAGWVKATTTPQATATPVQANTTTIAPSPVTPIQTAIQTVATVLAPAGDIAAQAAARATLAAWSKTDGISRAGVSDYGTTVEAAATTWTARDKLEAASFQAWANSVGLSTGPTSGDWTQELSDALRSWAEHKATQVLTPVRTTVAQTSSTTPTAAQTTTAPTITLPATVAIPTSVVTPAVTVSPGTANNGQITLPGITITPGQASAGAQQPTQSPSYWQQNKAQLVAGGVGLLATVAAKFI